MNNSDNVPFPPEQSRRSGEARLAYSVDELTSASCLGRSKIYEEIAAGRLKVRKVGKRTLILHGDALAWLKSLPAA